MAQDKRNRPTLLKRILPKINFMKNTMDSIYQDTYSSSPQNSDDLNKVVSDIEDNISQIMVRNNTSDVSNISALYSSIQFNQLSQVNNYMDSVTSFFGNKSVTDTLLNSYLENKWIKELDYEIDTVCKYMPKLDEALQAIKDAVLCADNFEKEYLNFVNTYKSQDEMATFIQETEAIKKAYDFYDKVEKWYDNTSKYGEEFVYCVPYNKALAELQSRKPNTMNRSTLVGRSGIGRATTLISENGSLQFDTGSQISQFKDTQLRNLKLEIVEGTSLLQSAIDESTILRDLTSIAESCSVLEASKETFDTVFDKFEIPKEYDTTSSDGLSSLNKTKSTTDKSIKVPGCIIKSLKRENIIMLYIDDICLGYYYLEFLDNRGLDFFSSDRILSKGNNLPSYSQNIKYNDMQNQTNATEELLKYLSSAIAQQLDNKFINANPNLKKEIYSILKYNDIYNAYGLDKIRVTYLAPNDVEHITFNEDPDTHRGQSDLLKSLIPAKLWCCLYIANTLGMLTRGQDKRVYYVKQNVEQNIAQTLLNVINQIKKQNFNIMQIESMNSILGITGKYNDYIIPVGPSGDPPITMEVMQGQDIDPQTEFLDKLEETAINPIGVPIELINARLSLDFATQLTMSNSKFLRFVFKRQSKFEIHLSNIFTKIYNSEYPSNTYEYIKCILPSPILLNLNNLNQIIDMVNQQAENISQLQYPDTTDENNEIKKAIFKKNYVMYKLGGYIKQNEIELIKDMTEMEFTKSINKNNDNTNM